MTIQEVYDVTAGVRSAYTKKIYNWSFKLFLTHTGITDPSILLRKILENWSVNHQFYYLDGRGEEANA